MKFGQGMSFRSSGIIVLLILVAKNRFSKLNRRQKMLICTRYLSGLARTPAPEFVDEQAEHTEQEN